MKVRCLLSLLISLTHVYGFTQMRGNNIIKGVIIDGKTKEPLVGARVYDLNNLRVFSQTNKEGHFELELAESQKFLKVNYNCSWMDIIVKIKEGKEIIIEYGTKKSKRETKKFLKRKLKFD